MYATFVRKHIKRRNKKQKSPISAAKIMSGDSISERRWFPYPRWQNSPPHSSCYILPADRYQGGHLDTGREGRIIKPCVSHVMHKAFWETDASSRVCSFSHKRIKGQRIFCRKSFFSLLLKIKNLLQLEFFFFMGFTRNKKTIAKTGRKCDAIYRLFFTTILNWKKMIIFYYRTNIIK